MKGFAFLLAFLLTGCGYQFGEGELSQRFDTFSVRFAKGDLSGHLTEQVIRRVASETALTYVNDGADLELLLELVEVDEENVGFRYDRNKHNRRVDYIIPSETRLRAYVQLTLMDRARGCVLAGPTLLEADYEFDHDYYTSHSAVNIFSLGQVTDYDEAYEAALKPLYENLAQKVADYLKYYF